MLHEMVHGDLKALFHALADGDGRHDHDELRPAVALVQLEHGLDVHIGLARARLHLHIQTAPPQVAHQRGGLLDVVLGLQCADILKQPLVRQIYVFIAVASLFDQVELFPELVPQHGHLLILRLRVRCAQIA